MAFNRTDAMKRLEAQDDMLDIVVVGGGATGASVALDAAARGMKVALLEQHDFGKGTSSRSTKLIHGGVRYTNELPFVRYYLAAPRMIISQGSNEI